MTPPKSDSEDITTTQVYRDTLTALTKLQDLLRDSDPLRRVPSRPQAIRYAVEVAIRELKSK